MSQSYQKRVNFFISHSQLESMKRLISHTKTSQSDFIREAINEHIDRINKQKLEKKLEEGYKAMAKEHRQFAESSAKTAKEVIPPWK